MSLDEVGKSSKTNDKTQHHFFFHHHYHPNGPGRRAHLDMLTHDPSEMNSVMKKAKKSSELFEDLSIRDLMASVDPDGPSERGRAFPGDPEEMPDPEAFQMISKPKWKAKAKKKLSSSRNLKKSRKKLSKEDLSSYVGDIDSLLSDIPDDYQDFAGFQSQDAEGSDDGDRPEMPDLPSHQQGRTLLRMSRTRKPVSPFLFQSNPGYTQFETKLLQFILENTNLVSSIVSKQQLAKCMLQCANNLANPSEPNVFRSAKTHYEANIPSSHPAQQPEQR